MKLIIVRHGLAVDREEFIKKNTDDSLRPLTEKGRDRTHSLARELRRIVEDVDLIVTSPLVRAKQTAQILRPELDNPPILESVELIPSAPPVVFAQWMKAKIKHETNVIVVGHEPQVSSFVAWCLTGFNEPFLEMKKSGAACLEFENLSEIAPKSAFLRWLITPKTLDLA